MPVSARSCGRYGTRARVAIPLSIGGRIIGAISFVSTREERLVARAKLSAASTWSPRCSATCLPGSMRSWSCSASEERFRAVADDAPVMIWATGTDKTCRWINRRWLDFTGRTLEQALGSGWTDSVHPDDLSACLQAYTKRLRRAALVQY